MSITVDARAIRMVLINDGYAVFRKIVPVERCNAVIQSIGEELGIWIDQPASYDRVPTEIDEVPMRGHQSQWGICQSPDLHSIWSPVWDTDRLWVDRNDCRFTPPWRPGRADALKLHWDVDPWDRRVQWYSGILALTDCRANAGGFCCVPRREAVERDWPKRPSGRPHRLRVRRPS